MWKDNDGGIDMNSEREVILMYSHRENVITYDCESVEHASDLFVQVAERLVPCSSNCLPPVTLFCYASDLHRHGTLLQKLSTL